MYIYMTQFNVYIPGTTMFAQSSGCLHIPVYIIIYEVHSILYCTFYFIAHFTPYFFLIFILFLPIFILTYITLSEIPIRRSNVTRSDRLKGN